MWNGSFSPKITKSIGTVRFVTLSDMSARDWAWLDYDNIRTVARNRIAAMISSGNLMGFFQVMITEKARAKNEYFWPAAAVDVQEFAETEDATFFINRKEVEDDSTAAENVENTRLSMVGLTPATGAVIVSALSRYVEGDRAEQINSIDENLLSSLNTNDMRLLLTAVMAWQMSLEEAESLLDDMPESDEADDVRNWIEDRVAEVQRARYTLAAGRGIK